MLCTIPCLCDLENFLLSCSSLHVALCCRTFKEHCLVFLQTKKAVHRLRIIFGLLGLNSTELHGNLSQLQGRMYVHTCTCVVIYSTCYNVVHLWQSNTNTLNAQYVTRFEKGPHFTQNTKFSTFQTVTTQHYGSFWLLAWFVGGSGLLLNKSKLESSAKLLSKTLNV